MSATHTAEIITMTAPARGPPYLDVAIPSPPYFSCWLKYRCAADGCNA